MSENITVFECRSSESIDTPGSSSHGDGNPTMIKVDNVSMVFNMASEQLNSLKEYAIKIARRELFFEGFTALDNISFEVKKGDVFGIIGTNGSGKSTLLKIIAGVLDPTKGTCDINGNIAPLIELGAGFDMDLTARENIYLNGALLGYPKNFIEQHFDEIVDFAEIEDFLEMPLKNYSSGMVARIAFAIATVIVPDILIVDEVLSVGDFMFQQKCERRITELIKEHDVTVLIVSHNNDQIERLCNKAIWIEKGHTKMYGSAHEVCQTYRVLGGKIGSPASEKTVFEMLNDPQEYPEDSLTTISAESRYGSSVKIIEQCSFSNDRDLILTPGDHIPENAVAVSFSGLTDAPVLMVKPNSIPDVVRQAIKRLSPRRIFLVGNEDKLGDGVTRSLEECCGRNVETVRIGGADLTYLALEAFLCGSKEGEWGSTAIVISENNAAALITLSPLLFAKRAPLFLSSSADAVDDAVTEAILHGNFKHVVMAGGSGSTASRAMFESAGLEVTCFSENEAYYDNKVISDWIIDGASELDPIEKLLICSIANPVDALTAGLYCGKNHAAVLFEDPRDINSISEAIIYIINRHGGISSLTFLGNELIFGEHDKKLLAKAVAKCRTSNSTT